MATQDLTEDVVLRTISAFEVLDGNPLVKDDLLSACQEQGFFYLDCRGTVLEEVSELYRVAQAFFDLSLDEKLEYDVETQGPEKYNGWVNSYLCLVLSIPYTDIQVATRLPDGAQVH